jgi:hypothetical protein
MSTSPEKCLGNLIKDINEEVNPDDFYSLSKDISSTKSFKEQKLSLNSIYSFRSSSTSTSSGSFFFTKKSILNAFNNQHDTILLQKMLMEASKDTLDLIIKEMSGTFSFIIKNKNGNYFCSDLFKSCDEKQRIVILKEISLTIAEDCLDEYGTHSIQTLIENSSSEEEYKLILSSFNDCQKISKAAKNSNGFFVIQKILNHIPEIYRMEFNYLFLKLFYELSLDVYGISTVKAFTLYTKNKEIMNEIWNLTYTNFLSIAKNQYGNYLIQSMLEHWGNSNPGIKLKKMCITHFSTLMDNHYSKFICDLFINRSNIEEKKIVLAILLKNKQNINIFNTNKKSHDFANKFDIDNKNDKNTNFQKGENNQINNNINIPLSNNAKPFYPKKRNKGK